jgi:hypothetical protein
MFPRFSMTNRLPLTSFSRLHDKRGIPPDVFRTNSRIPLGRAIVSALPLAICLILSAIPMRASDSLRDVIDLNGEWMIAEGSMTKRPESFNHRVPVPGLVDMATPSFEFAGIELPQREAYWYRRTFRIDRELPATAWLKIHKARFGVRVWLNDQDLGEYLPSFTPGWFDLRSALRGNGAENELVIRMGADRRALPDGMAKGFDFEKKVYLSGFYDSVEIILTGLPRIINIQTVPDLEQERIRVVAEIETRPSGHPFKLEAVVTEQASGTRVGETSLPVAIDKESGMTKVDFSVPIANQRLWSPEDPFLYNLHLSTGADAMTVRFGMRSFRFDAASKRAMLNGKRYSLRGTNVPIFRFFEDSERGDLPWNDAWVRRLYRKFKDMHWNSIRFCIGFPPESWYRIADEEGFLIQDEYPVWLLGNQPIPDSDPKLPPDPVSAEYLIPEFTEWMRERWNHPCVVIWDAQNESITRETGKAIRAVRHLDLSNRPWENGWGEPQAVTDCVESHPYLFNRGIYNDQPPFRMNQMPTVEKVPNLLPDQMAVDAPILVNEYAWLWLNRAGDPTTVTRTVYPFLLGPDSTADQRRELQARYLAALTEFWRSYRTSVGVLHFSALSFSRRGDIPQPIGGATSDHWADVAHLQWQPYFEQYVRDAFSPVGIMLDFWEEQIAPGTRRTLTVRAINDLGDPWVGEIRLTIAQDDRPTSIQARPVSIEAYGDVEVSFEVALPADRGPCLLKAELVRDEDPPVASRRMVQVH